MIDTSQKARDYFKISGLTYKGVGEEELNILREMIGIELTKFLKEGDNHAQRIKMKVSRLFSHDVDTDKGLVNGFIFVDGANFKRREAISFNRDGFIGFVGWAGTANAIPFYKAFKKWCDLMVENKSSD